MDSAHFADGKINLHIICVLITNLKKFDYLKIIWFYGELIGSGWMLIQPRAMKMTVT